MGFLNGAYGKLMAGKLVRDLQYQMTGIQSQLRRVTRQVGDMEKMFTAQKRNMQAMMQSQMQNSIYGFACASGLPFAQNGDMNALGFAYANMAANGSLNSTQMQQYAMIQQSVQQQYSMASNMWQNMFEMQQEAMLQPLKDLEDDLQTQKDNLESRIKIAQAEYDAKKDEEKQGAQSLKPDYTGQG